MDLLQRFAFEHPAYFCMLVLPPVVTMCFVVLAAVFAPAVSAFMDDK